MSCFWAKEIDQNITSKVFVVSWMCTVVGRHTILAGKIAWHTKSLDEPKRVQNSNQCKQHTLQKTWILFPWSLGTVIRNVVPVRQIGLLRRWRLPNKIISEKRALTKEINTINRILGAGSSFFHMRARGRGVRYEILKQSHLFSYPSKFGSTPAGTFLRWFESSKLRGFVRKSCFMANGLHKMSNTTRFKNGKTINLTTFVPSRLSFYPRTIC